MSDETSSSLYCTYVSLLDLLLLDNSPEWDLAKCQWFYFVFFPPSGFNWKHPSCLILHTTRGKVFTQKPASISLALNHCQAQTQQLQVVCYWFIHFDPFSNPSPDLYLYKTHLHLRTFKTMVMQHQPKVWRHLLVQLFFFIFIRDT